jgi:hypothetical protein
MNGSGRGGDSRKKRRRFSRQPTERGREFSRYAPREDTRPPKAEQTRAADGTPEKSRGGLYDRPRWIPPKMSSAPVPSPHCPWCGKPIKDLVTAIADKQTGDPVHFDCVIARIGGGEHLENGDAVTYIGGGRFGIIHFNNLPDTRDFTIKKIFEWENKDDCSKWRQSLSDRFSVT